MTDVHNRILLPIGQLFNTVFCHEGHVYMQCLSQDFETGCLKLAVVKFLGVQIFKGDHNILIFLP